ncbi:MAG: adenylosuccinate lyase [Ignavibacteria bacterium]|jgi:adenylosuccinate lyase|nr:adenylosuccinate lyase [Ignavibacteria bacterium]
MIPRYTRKEMAAIWTDQHKYELWLRVELLACKAQAQLGIIPESSLNNILKNATLNIPRIAEIEEKTKHDVIAFISSIEEVVGEDSRFIHLGMTSSDVLDTALAVQMVEAGKLILVGMERLRDVLKQQAIKYKHTICIGRSHGIHAEPTTFGLKMALWYDECNRNIKRLTQAIDDAAVGMISGAVGTYEHISPEVEKYVCSELGLKPANVSTQVVQRDIHANYITALAIAATLLEKIATEIRHLQRTEVLEAEEYFSAGQKGSSAMPHKRNPISSENICGQVRLLRSYVIPALEDNALWHERDISHSSVERIVLPDATVTFDYILNRAIDVVENIVVYPDNMLRNLNVTKGLYASQKILLALINKGLKRQDAYVMVQKSAMETWSQSIPFKQTIIKNADIMQYFNESELEQFFAFDEIISKVDYIYNRLGI